MLAKFYGCGIKTIFIFYLLIYNILFMFHEPRQVIVNGLNGRFSEILLTTMSQSRQFSGMTG